MFRARLLLIALVLFVASRPTSSAQSIAAASQASDHAADHSEDYQTVWKGATPTGPLQTINDGQQKPAPGSIAAKDLRELGLEPTWADRLRRVWQYQYQLLEQPEYVTATSDGLTTTILNPNKWLQQHSILMNFAELVPRATSFPSMVEAAYSAQFANKETVTLDRSICKSGRPLDCLAGGGSFLGRAVSATTLSFSVAQRDEVQQGVLVPALSPTQGWAWSGQVDFNPVSLLINGTSWKNAADTLKTISGGKIGPAMVSGNVDGYPCFLRSRTGDGGAQERQFLAVCEKEFAAGKMNPSTLHPGWNKLAIALIPTFEFKAISQFDFIKEGGVLAANPQLQRALKNVSMTWDLRRRIASTTDRIAVATAFSPVKPDQAASEAATNKMCVLASGNSRSYLPVSPESTTNSCRTIAVDLGTVDHYAIACAGESSVTIGKLVETSETLTSTNDPKLVCWR